MHEIRFKTACFNTIFIYSFPTRCIYINKKLFIYISIYHIIINKGFGSNFSYLWLYKSDI